MAANAGVSTALQPKRSKHAELARDRDAFSNGIKTSVKYRWPVFRTLPQHALDDLLSEMITGNH